LRPQQYHLAHHDGASSMDVLLVLQLRTGKCHGAVPESRFRRHRRRTASRPPLGSTSLPIRLISANLVLFFNILFPSPAVQVLVNRRRTRCRTADGFPAFPHVSTAVADKIIISYTYSWVIIRVTAHGTFRAWRFPPLIQRSDGRFRRGWRRERVRDLFCEAYAAAAFSAVGLLKIHQQRPPRHVARFPATSRCFCASQPLVGGSRVVALFPGVGRRVSLISRDYVSATLYHLENPDRAPA